MSDIDMTAINGVITNLQNFVAGHADQAYQAAIEATRLHGVVELVTCAAAMPASYILARICAKFWPKAAEAENSYDRDGAMLGYGAISVISGAVSILIGIVSICGMLSSESWIEALNPQAALVLNILKHVK